MVKGVSVKFKSYEETIPALLRLIKFDNVLKQQERVVLKPGLVEGENAGTPVEFVEPVLKFCMENKNPGTEIFIAEGCDGDDTNEVFEERGYKRLAEKYGVGLIDLNKTEAEEIENPDFLRFDEIMYPRILKDSFVISLPMYKKHEEIGLSGALSNMVGAFPLQYYKSFFSKRKNKLDGVPFKYLIHDCLKCKMPEFSIGDASLQGQIFAGQPLEIDKQAAKLFGFNWKDISYLKLLEESFNSSSAENIVNE
jgi:uncharacterized protein (DUF362 family)